ncbi:MAG: amidohydrolase [Brevundimonas sp.]|nr:MAG: amidohydrolase [Brevundimonas sp.]
MPPEVIDAHVHLWRIGQHGCVWPGPDLPTIHRDFTPEDYLAIARRHGVTGAVLVQSQEDDADTEHLLEIAEAHDWARGVVGWVDVTREDAADRIAALAGRPLVGLRPMLQDRPPEWILQADCDAAIGALIDHDLALDALVKPQHLGPLDRFARRWPELRIVLDHGGKPTIGRDLGSWRDDVRRLADRPNLTCKLSGLLTETSDDATPEDLAAVVETLLDAFGPDRLMWGGDWPVLTLAGDYAEWLTLCRNLIPERDHGAVFGQTAARVYTAAAVDSRVPNPHSDFEYAFKYESLARDEAL